MKTLSTLRISLVFILVSWLSGCAQQPVVAPTEDPTQLTALAADVLARAVYTNTLFNQCTPLGDEAELEAITVQQDWIDKNWATIIAADHYYTTQLGSQSLNYNDEVIALPAILLAHNARQRAITELNLKQRTLSNQQRTCVRRIQALSQQEMDLAQTPQAVMDLQALRDQYTGNTTRIVPVPTLAGAVSTDLENGRSYFLLAEEFKKECANARFIVLTNQWPREAYATYCNEVPVSLITCEWGKCSRQ